MAKSEGLCKAPHGARQVDNLRNDGAGAPEHRVVHEGADLPGTAREVGGAGHLLPHHREQEGWRGVSPGLRPHRAD